MGDIADGLFDQMLAQMIEEHCPRVDDWTRRECAKIQADHERYVEQRKEAIEQAALSEDEEREVAITEGWITPRKVPGDEL